MADRHPLLCVCSVFVGLVLRDGVQIRLDVAVQSPSAWSKRLVNLMDRAHALRADIPVLTAHELHHTYGTKLRRDGVDIYTIAKVLGHRDINVTANVYVKEDVKMLREALGIASSKTENSVQVSSKCRQVIPS